MPKKDYYITLGISRKESPSGIHKAFKDLALRYHPDRAGPEGTRTFQEINEAYQVLSNPEFRADYDRCHDSGSRLDISAEPMRKSSSPCSPSPPFTRHPQPEPMISRPLSIFNDFEVAHPSFDTILSQFLSNFMPGHLPKSRRIQQLTLEFYLSPEEAEEGGIISIGIPVYVSCFVCEGTGGNGYGACPHCDGQGLTQKERPVQVSLPPQVKDRSVFEVPIHQHGIRNLQLTLLVRISQ